MPRSRAAYVLTLTAVIAAILAIPALRPGLGGTAPFAAPEIAVADVPPGGIAAEAPTRNANPAAPASTTRTEPSPVCAPGTTPESRRVAAACLLSGRGMWIWEFDTVEGGDPEAIVARAKREGLSHVLIRAGSSRMGFYAQPHLDAILPVAHREGLKVLAWDFPYLEDPVADAKRVAAELAYTTPDGHRIDGLAPDVEEPAQGVNLTREGAETFARELRERIGPSGVVVMCTPRPSPPRLANYPYAEMAPYVDAWAPMVYWSFDGPELDTRLAIERLGAYGQPVAPVGRAYDMRPEGGPDQPPASETRAFLQTARELGAPGVSFWSWQHASDESWRTIREFDWPSLL